MSYLEKMEGHWMDATSKEDYVIRTISERGVLHFTVADGVFDSYICRFVMSFADLLNISIKLGLVMDFENLVVKNS